MSEANVMNIVFYLGYAVWLLLAAYLVKVALGIVFIGETEVGIVVKKFSLDGKTLADGAIIALNGEPGVQADVLSPGMHLWYWPVMYEVQKKPITIIKSGSIGIVATTDGKPMPSNRIIASSLHCDCNMYQNAKAFLTNGGFKGKQAEVLTAGAYRINTALFSVKEVPVTEISSDKVGIITVADGADVPVGHMAAPQISGHNSFQDPAAFIKFGGCRGLQEQILLAGQYNINPWFAEIQQESLYEVPIGSVGVVVSFVGNDSTDISGEKFTHGNIVAKGSRGVWAEPLYPGKHPINKRCMKVELVPTTNIVLNWATGLNESHKLDEKLSTIKVMSGDGFSFTLDVSQIINIGAKDAAYVISRVGSVSNLVNQVLEPIIGNYFRNSSQKYDVLSFLSNRAERQQEARDHISRAIQEYNVVSVDTLIGDIVPPGELMKTLTDRKVASEQEKTYTTQITAQDTRKKLTASTALADKQAELVNEEQNIIIAERKAQAIKKSAEGEAAQIQLRGEAEARIVSIKGNAQADSVRAVGLATAEAAKAGVEAMGSTYAQVEIFRALAQNGIKLVPDVLVSGDKSDGSITGMLLGMITKGQA